MPGTTEHSYFFIMFYHIIFSEPSAGLWWGWPAPLSWHTIRGGEELHKKITKQQNNKNWSDFCWVRVRAQFLGVHLCKKKKEEHNPLPVQVVAPQHEGHRAEGQARGGARQRERHAELPAGRCLVGWCRLPECLQHKKVRQLLMPNPLTIDIQHHSILHPTVAPHLHPHTSSHTSPQSALHLTLGAHFMPYVPSGGFIRSQGQGGFGRHPPSRGGSGWTIGVNLGSPKHGCCGPG